MKKNILFLLLLTVNLFAINIRVEIEKQENEIDVADNVKEIECSILSNTFVDAKIENIYVTYDNFPVLTVNVKVVNKGNMKGENIKVISGIVTIEEATEEKNFYVFTNIVTNLSPAKNYAVEFPIAIKTEKEYDIVLFSRIENLGTTNLKLKYKKFVLRQQDGIFKLYDNKHTHQYICEEAGEIFGLNLFGYNSLDYPFGPMPYGYLGNTDSTNENTICGGAWHEDEVNHIWPDVIQASATHAWDADDPDTDTGFGQGFVIDTSSAWNESKHLWREQVLPYYVQGRKAEAYERLGHVAHLLCDMTVPAHAHQDFHTGYDFEKEENFIRNVLLGYLDIVTWGLIHSLIGDDSYEDWIYYGGYEHWTSEDAKKAGGLIDIPWDKRPPNIEEYIFPLYYLMYTANQTGDYFACDDVEGDCEDRHGWMNYLDWEGPIEKEELSPLWPFDFGNNDNGDNDNDGDLTKIGNECFVYAIRATATLYKIFWNTVQPHATIISHKNGDYINDTVLLKAYVEFASEVRGVIFQYRGHQKTYAPWLNIGSEIPTPENRSANVYYTRNWDAINLPAEEYEIRALAIKKNGRYSDIKYQNSNYSIWIVKDITQPNWLVSGYYKSGDFNSDYLVFGGGEKNIQPYKGLSIPYGLQNTNLVWTNSLIDRNMLNNNLSEVYGNIIEGGISYIHTYVKANVNLSDVAFNVKSYGHKIWLNGSLIDSTLSVENTEISKTILGLSLHQGWNSILIKLAHRGNKDFGFRISDKDGYAIDSITNFAESPVVVKIVSPLSGKGIFTNKPLDFKCTTAGIDFGNYWRLEYTTGVPTDIVSATWVGIASNTTAVEITNQTLYTFDPTGFTNGIYTFKLTTPDSFGKEVYDISTICINRELLTLTMTDMTNNIIEYDLNKTTKVYISIYSNTTLVTNLVTNTLKLDGENEVIWYDAINGNYTVEVRAWDESLAKWQTNTKNLTIQDMIYLTNLQCLPASFSPNDDGTDDVCNITYGLSENSDVKIAIYNTNNMLVKILQNYDNIFETLGESAINWDGKNESGMTVLDGNYIVKIEVKGLHENIALPLQVNVRVTNVGMYYYKWISWYVSRTGQKLVIAKPFANNGVIKSGYLTSYETFDEYYWVFAWVYYGHGNTRVNGRRYDYKLLQWY